MVGSSMANPVILGMVARQFRYAFLIYPDIPIEDMPVVGQGNVDNFQDLS